MGIAFENDYFVVWAKSFGEYQTNCYVLNSKSSEDSLIIDPGVDATAWVLEKTKTPLVIMNTHGHFDHVWSNAELKAHFASIPLLCPIEDSFMLQEDCFSLGLPLSSPDILVGKEREPSSIGPSDSFCFGDFVVEYACYPGHTPGCSVIVVYDKKAIHQKIMFSGDFIFYRSIGRSDFPYSSSALMKQSLLAFLEWQEDMPIFPGHGQSSFLKQEQANLPYWIDRLDDEA